jgi:PAS domain S-box-containing protein
VTQRKERPDGSAPEAQERLAAMKRGRRAHGAQTASERDGGPLARHAFVALAESVRDYAVFLVEPSGRICYWGEGARLMKWWTPAEAEGSHLRLLYPDGGSEDGTAEDHLRQAAERGEYVGEGRRVRRGGTTFWGSVCLTALRDAEGALIGFAKVTRDLTVQRASEAMLAAAWVTSRERDAAVSDAAATRERQEATEDRLEFALEQVRSARVYASEVLERDIGDMTFEHAEVLREMTLLNEQLRRLERERDGHGA